MTSIRKINQTYLFLLCLVLALTLRIKYEINFPQLDSDYATETEAAKNFIEGKGFSISRANPNNLSEISYSTLSSWPVGYAMALVPLYYLTGSFINAAVLLQCLSTVTLLLGFIKLFKVLGASKKTMSLFLLFYAFTPTPFSYLGTTDMLTGALFLWATAAGITLYESDKSIWEIILVISILLVISCMLRFASIPNIIILPLFLGICAVWQKKSRLFIPAALITLFSLTGAFIFFTIFKIDNGRTSFLQNLIHFNLYFKNMLWFDSFPIKALFFPRPLEYRLPNNLLVIRGFRIALYMASLLFAGYMIYYFYKKIRNSTAEKHLENNSVKKMLILLIILFSSTVIICSFLSVQSLATPPESNSFGPPWMPNMWTFVYSTRYFAILILLFQVLFFMLLQDALEKIVKQKVVRLLTISLFISALFTSIVQFAYTTKQYHFGNGAASFWNTGKEEIEIFNMLNRSVEDNPQLKTIYSCYNRLPYDGGSITLYSKAFVCMNYKQMLAEGFKHAKPVILFVLLPNDNLNEKESAFISDYKPEMIKQFNEGTLYKSYLR